MQLPEQATLTHTYNPIGQLANIDYQGPAHSWWVKAIRWVWEDYGTQTLITDLDVDSVRGLTGFTHSNGLTVQAKHDKAGRLVTWQDGQVSSQLQFNQADKLESIQKQTPKIIQASLNSQPTHSAQTQQLAYNVYGQLTQVNATAAQTIKLKDTIKAVIDERYQLDLNGNRLSNQDKNQSNQHYQYQANTDRLLSVKGNHHTKYAYNSLGEPIQIQQQNKQSQLNRQIYYGARGQISRITDNGKPTATYQYNHARQRTHKQTQSQNTYYLWHGGLVDAEIEQSTATSNHTKNNKNNNSAHITKRYIYLGLKPVAVIDYNVDNQASIYAIHTDYLGTPQAVTNAKQQVVWRAEYTPFGQIKNQQAVALTVASDTTRNNQSNGFISTANATTDHNAQKSFEFNLRFAGQYQDQETGYYYNWHRYYNPETGRYLTPDPIGLQGGMNAYAYTNSDPMGSVDPWGLYSYIIWGHRKDTSLNVFGHIAIAIDDPNGGPTKVYSFGNKSYGINAVDYINKESTGLKHGEATPYPGDEGLQRNQSILTLDTTKEQEKAMIAKAEELSKSVGKIDNCANRVDAIIKASGVSHWHISVPTPGSTYNRVKWFSGFEYSEHHIKAGETIKSMLELQKSMKDKN